jgi:hypothetical protein
MPHWPDEAASDVRRDPFSQRASGEVAVEQPGQEQDVGSQRLAHDGGHLRRQRRRRRGDLVPARHPLDQASAFRHPHCTPAAALVGVDHLPAVRRRHVEQPLQPAVPIHAALVAPLEVRLAVVVDVKELEGTPVDAERIGHEIVEDDDVRSIATRDVEEPLYLRAELRNLAVHQQPGVKAVLRDLLPARRLERPGFPRSPLVLLQQEPHPQVIRREHRQRIANQRDEPRIGIEAADPFDGLGQVEVGHGSLAHGLVRVLAVGEVTIQIVPLQLGFGRIVIQPREVMGLLRLREAYPWIPLEVAAERGRAAARRPHHEEIESGRLIIRWFSDIYRIRRGGRGPPERAEGPNGGKPRMKGV